ncbi:MAG: hypothetical protein M3Q94_19630 [Pseudomonadota bacterium]|nr:hypothetical protein [Pseudomonadota bacterium]
MKTAMPKKEMLRQNEVVRWLGINEKVLLKWVRSGIITRKTLAPGDRGFYSRDEIARKILGNEG